MKGLVRPNNRQNAWKRSGEPGVGGLAIPSTSGRRHHDLRESDAALGQPELVADEGVGRVRVADVQSRRLGRSGSTPHPLPEAADRRLHDHVGAVRVEALGAELAGRRRGGRRGAGQRVFVGVGSTGHLPEPEALRVGLMRVVGAQDDEVTFGLQIEDRFRTVGANDRCRRQRGRVVQRGRPGEPRKTKKPSKAWTSGLTALM